MLNLKVGNIFTDIEGVVLPELYSKLQRDMAFRPLGYEFSTMYNKWILDSNGKRVRRMWDGWRRQIWKSRDRKRIFFPTGLLSLAKQTLDKKDVEYRIINCRVKPTQEMPGIEFADHFTIRDYQALVVDDACSLQRGIIQLPTGSGKCLGKGTPVLMFDGSIKAVENITVGEILMGPDSKPREVLSTSSGVDNLYRIKPKQGDSSFVVNSSHILSLQLTNSGKPREDGGEIVNISVCDYLKQNNYFKHRAKGYRSPIDFAAKEVPVDPYFLGVWLGDGRSICPEITTEDSEIAEYLEKFASSLSMKLNKKQYGTKCPQYAIVNKKRGMRSNSLLDSLRTLEVINNKHVPHLYKANCRDVRLAILAGLMDSDGSLHHGGYDYISKIEQLSRDVAYLSRSLGLRARVTPCLKTCTNNGVAGEYFRVSISGDCSIIPVRIARKKAHQRKQKKNCLRFGFEIESVGRGAYYGFEISGDRLFMLGDFTVTHNTIVAGGIIQKLKVKPFIFFVTSIDLLTQAKESFEDILRENGEPITVGQIGGGVIDIRDINVMTVQTAVRSLGEEWDKDHKFDSDDQDDKTPIQNKADVLNLLKNAKGSICDECLTGDSIVTTQNGLQYIKNLSQKIGEEVLSFNGSSVVWKKITNFYKRGKQKIVTLTLSNGTTLRCTADHLIQTSNGWMTAGSLHQGEKVLCCVNADADNVLTLQDEVQVSARLQKLNSWQNGCPVDMAKPLSTHTEDITPSILELTHENKLSQKSENTSQYVCNISYVSVNSVQNHDEEEEVYDISIEGTHCFFANGILVHNCQHWKAETCQLVARSLVNAYYTYGMSATPYRDEGDDLIIQGCFGKNIAELSASQLIRDKWLVRPSIKIVHIRGPKSKFRQWQQLYKEQVTENLEYNEIVSSIANSYIKEGRLVLVLVQQIKHGKILSEMIPGSVFLSGASSKKLREESIKKLRERKISCITSTVIFDEGIDVRPLDTILLAGQGRSKVRAMQRIGRILRPFPGKTVATAVDFRIHQKYLLKHSIAREKMYRTEEEYQIEEIDPGE